MNEFPAGWLVHFSKCMPIILVRRFIVSKHHRKYLTTNAVWLQRMSDLKAFQDLTHYEKHVMIQPEGFWYKDWYQLHCTRYVEVRNASKVMTTMPNGKTQMIDVPQVGTLFKSDYVYYVAVEVKIANGKPHLLELCRLDDWAIKHTKGKHIARCRLIDSSKCKVRENGNYSMTVTMFKL